MIVVENVHPTLDQLQSVINALEIINVKKPSFEIIYVEHVNNHPKPFILKFHVLLNNAPAIINYEHRNAKLFNAHLKGKLDADDIISILVDAIFVNKHQLQQLNKEIKKINEELNRKFQDE